MELINERNEAGLREFFVGHHPADSAELLDDLEPEEVLFVLKLLDGRERAAVFSYLEPHLQEGVTGLMERRPLGRLAHLHVARRAGRPGQPPAARTDRADHAAVGPCRARGHPHAWPPTAKERPGRS